ncbi:MAG: rhomboid family intramembrane serine protease [Acidimicrobiales bacterium]
MEATTKPQGRAILRLPRQILWLVGTLAVMWLIEIVDTVALSDRLQGGGIHPRSADGLDGIAWAPFLHTGFGHLIGNSLPFLVLGGLVALRGVRTWLTVTITVIVVGGMATWLLARTGNHIGASGLVFGYLGYLVGAAWFERSFKAIALAAVAGVLYWSLVFGLIPAGQVSWEGHLFGAAAGITAAYLTRDSNRTQPPEQALEDI